MQLREALRSAMTEEMERDENVFLMGEEVAQYNGAYKVSEGMLDKFGPRRVFDTPISEAAFSGLGIGAAMVGLRPIIEYMSWSFTLVCLDQLVNNAANVRYMSGGQFKVPIVFRGGNGIAHQLGRDAQPSRGIDLRPHPRLGRCLPQYACRRQGVAQELPSAATIRLFFSKREDAERYRRGARRDRIHAVPIGVANVETPGQLM